MLSKCLLKLIFEKDDLTSSLTVNKLELWTNGEDTSKNQLGLTALSHHPLGIWDNALANFSCFYYLDRYYVTGS